MLCSLIRRLTFENVENATKAKNGLHGADIYANSCTIKAEFAKVGGGVGMVVILIFLFFVDAITLDVLIKDRCSYWC